jgi:spore coat polysaccharide biosynthesis predicted glycosyltransferase SpsG
VIVNGVKATNIARISAQAENIQNLCAIYWLNEKKNSIVRIMYEAAGKSERLELIIESQADEINQLREENNRLKNKNLFKSMNAMHSLH